MRRAVTSPVVLAVALGGCTLGPKYRTPPTPASAQGEFQSAQGPHATLAEPPDDWWKLYKDPALDALVGQALVANKDLAVAVANLELERGLLDEARAARLPSTTPTGGADLSRRAAANGFPATGFNPVYSLGFSASYEVDLFGRVRRAIQAASRDVEAEQAALDLVRVSTAAETTRAYLDACAYGEAVGVARRSVEVVVQSNAILQVQRRAGSISDYELTRADALLAQARAAIPPLEAQRKAAIYRLSVLTGRPPAEPIPAAEACAKPPETDAPLPVGDGAGLIARRPDIREAERRLAGATARIGVATAGLYPTVSLGGQVSSAATKVSGLVNNQNIGLSLGPMISWSFPNQAVARARIRQSNATAAADLAQFDSTVLNALSETEQDLAAYAGQLQRREELRRAVASDIDALNLTQLRYTAGSVGFLDLLDAQRSLVTDQAALASADQTIADASVSVFKALGGGWRSAEATEPSGQLPGRGGG